MDRLLDNMVRGISEYLGIPFETCRSSFNPPPKPEMGDFAFSSFGAARILKKKPAEIAAGVEGYIREKHAGTLSRVEATGPYVNISFSAGSLAGEVLGEISGDPVRYGSSSTGSGMTVVIDYSSPNIAKPFGIGHIRSTVIGGALCRIYRHLGYRVLGINHYGDWGTQFGILMAAFEEEGDEAALRADPLGYSYDLYVRHSRRFEEDESAREKARLWFKRLEDGDPEAVLMWNIFREGSLAEFKRIYEILDACFEHHMGESFYNDKMEATLDRLRSKGLVVEDEGALIVDLSEFGMPPCLLRKSDGATTYALRDITAAEYRAQEFKFSAMLYVVGTPQKLHFRQVFKVLELMGYPWARDLVHVDFGHIVGMSTRKGSLILFEDVLAEAKERVHARMAESRASGKMDISEPEDEIAERVAVGAIVFNDLKNRRTRDVIFNWEQLLNFDGETGPYLQYTFARISGILRKSAVETPSPVNYSLLAEPEVKRLILTLGGYPSQVERAAQENEPSLISTCLLEVAEAFNAFYNRHRVLVDEPDLRAARLHLITCTQAVIGSGLKLLGITPLDRM
jgi:arginyl-tRNA synthetase